MKKRLMVLTIIILLAAIGMAAAMTVTLNSATVSGSGVTLSCLGDATDEGTLTKVEFRTNTAGAMAVNYTNISLTLATHTVTREITGIANGNYNWNCRFFNNSGSDSGNATAASDGTFTVNVASNVAPSFTGTIANVEFAEDAVKSNAFDLDTYFTDATAMTFRVTGNTSIIVSIASDSQVTFSAPANWSGAENMTFIASDGSLTNSSNGVLVNVTAANDVPYLISIVPNQTWPANTNRSFDLSGYFGDVESATLNYTASSVPHITAYFSGSTVTLSPESNWTGSTAIIFYANDSVNVGTGNTVYLAVQSNSSANQPPSINSYKPLLTIVKMKDTDSRTFEITKSDPNGDTMTVKWQLDNADIADATADSYALSSPAVGNHTLKVIVSDGTLATPHSWDVSVRRGISSSEADTSAPMEATTPPPSIINTDYSIKKECNENNYPDPGETCSNCPEDVKCADDEVCTDGACTKKTSSMKAILIVLAIAVAIGGGIFLFYRLNTHKETVSAHRGGIIDSSRVDIRKVSDTPVSEVNDFYNKPKLVADTPKAELRDVKGQKRTEIKDPKDEQLDRYIREMRAAGRTEQEILTKLREKGWPSWQIEFALKKGK